MTLDLLAPAPAVDAASDVGARATRHAHAAIGAQLARLGPPTDGPRFLRPLVRTGYSVLLAAAPFLALTAADRLAPLPDVDTDQPDPATPSNAEARAHTYARTLTFVLAEAAVRLDLPAFLPTLPLLRAALQLRARQHLSFTPQVTAALIAAHTPALLLALRAGEAEAAECHVQALRAAMLVEHPNFELDLQPSSAAGTANKLTPANR